MVSIVAVFIQTGHLQQTIQQGSIIQLPINTSQTYTVQIRALRQHIGQVNSRALLNRQSGDILIICNLQVGQIVQVLSAQTCNRRQLSLLDFAALSECDTSNTRAASIELFQIRTASQTDGLLQVWHVLQVQMLKQCVVTNREVSHIRILVTLDGGANLQVSQFYTMAEINIAWIEARDITNTLDNRSIVNVNFGIVHCRNRALNLVSLTTLTTHLHRVRTIPYRDISISVGDNMESTIGLHACPVCRSVTTNGHIIRGASSACIL